MSRCNCLTLLIMEHCSLWNVRNNAFSLISVWNPSEYWGSHFTVEISPSRTCCCCFAVDEMYIDATWTDVVVLLAVCGELKPYFEIVCCTFPVVPVSGLWSPLHVCEMLLLERRWNFYFVSLTALLHVEQWMRCCCCCCRDVRCHGYRSCCWWTSPLTLLEFLRWDIQYGRHSTAAWFVVVVVAIGIYLSGFTCTATVTWLMTLTWCGW